MLPLPEEHLRAITFPLYAAECSNKSFKNILSVIENLSSLRGAKDVILSELFTSSDEICKLLNQDLKKLVQALESEMDDLSLQQLILEYFTPSHSRQAKFLRILKAIDFIYSRKKVAIKATPSSSDPSNLARNWRLRSNSVSDLSDVEENIKDCATEIEISKTERYSWHAILAKNNYQELWQLINTCLALMQSNTRFHSTSFSLLPVVECIMIICKYRLMLKGVDENTSAHHETSEEWFLSFTDKHRKILNGLIRKTPKLLRGSFSLLVKNSKVLDFDNKRNYFNQQLHKKPPNVRGIVKYVNIRRQYIFQDSYYQLSNIVGEELKYGKLSIRFNDEEAADYGGVTREWYQELTKEMFNPNYALFTPSAEKMGVTYQPNPSSWVNPSHLLYFKFVGRIIGKAVYDSRLLDCYFTRSVYKHILGKSVDVSDMEAIDPEYHKSLVWIIENNITDILDLTFSTEVDEFGQRKVIDLKPDGENIVVTEENKHEYVKLVVENRLTTAIKEQLHSFLSGFYEIIPKDLIQIFNEKELELLISGVPDIDLDDWKNNTEYRGYSASSIQIQWFWRAVRSFDQEERAKLLQFSSGTSKVPLEGFGKLQGIGGLQKFQIHKDFGSTDRLPSAHTCFNQVDLPVYDSYEQLRERLYVSITEGATGFGFE